MCEDGLQGARGHGIRISNSVGKYGGQIEQHHLKAATLHLFCLGLWKSRGHTHLWMTIDNELYRDLKIFDTLIAPSLFILVADINNG